MIFIDTGALYALVVAGDPEHSAVQQWYDANLEPLVTTDYCVDELLTLLVARKRADFAIATGWKVFKEELCSLHFLTVDQIRRAWIVFQSQHGSGWSFTDCTSKIVIDDLRIGTAVERNAAVVWCRTKPQAHEPRAPEWQARCLPYTAAHGVCLLPYDWM